MGWRIKKRRYNDMEASTHYHTPTLGISREKGGRSPEAKPDERGTFGTRRPSSHNACKPRAPGTFPQSRKDKNSDTTDKHARTMENRDTGDTWCKKDRQRQ